MKELKLNPMENADLMEVYKRLGAKVDFASPEFWAARLKLYMLMNQDDELDFMVPFRKLIGLPAVNRTIQ